MKRYRVHVCAVLFLCLIGCKKADDGQIQAKLLGAQWSPVSGEIKGISFTVDVPAGVPRNNESLVGPDWWINTGREIESWTAGPRLSLLPRQATYTQAEEFAASVVDQTRTDLVELEKRALPNGRLRYVHTVHDGNHLDVALWIPIDDLRGLHCTAHWYHKKEKVPEGKSAPPDLIAWLSRFCDSVKVDAPTNQ